VITTFALHPAASKHLIAQAVALLPEVENAFRQGKIFIGAGTGNLAVAQELLHIEVDKPEAYVAGVITQQCVCSTAAGERRGPFCIEKGKLVQVDNWLDFIRSMEAGDIFIKGANALDPEGNVGILMADPTGGTIGNALGILKAQGIPMITPVGREKLIPSCREAEKLMGRCRIGHRFGLKAGYMVVSNSTVITEIESIKILTGLDAVQVAGGGVGGMEGAVMLAAEYENEEQALYLLGLVKEALRQPSLKIKHKKCSECTDPCDFMAGVRGEE
jgi:hypothetical protein